MKAKKFILAALVLFGIGMTASCTDDTASDDQLYDQQAIDKDEITEDDT